MFNNLINGVNFASVSKTFQPIYTVRTATNRQPDLPVGIVQLNIAGQLKAPVIRQGHAHQTVAIVAGIIPAVELSACNPASARTACIKCHQRIQHYPRPRHTRESGRHTASLTDERLPPVYRYRHKRGQ